MLCILIQYRIIDYARSSERDSRRAERTMRDFLRFAIALPISNDFLAPGGSDPAPLYNQ